MSNMPEIDLDLLSQHRIARIATRRLRSRWPRLLGRNAIFEEHGYGREFLVREVVTDRGAMGWGLSRRLGPQRTPELEGRRVSELFDPAVGVTADEALPLDFALHDLAGVILGVPVHRMLGWHGLGAVCRGHADGSRRSHVASMASPGDGQAMPPSGVAPREVPVYGAATYMDDITPAYQAAGVQAVLDHARLDWQLGYRGFKIKIGRGHRWMERRAGLLRDVEVTRRVREAFPDAQIMVDANNAYSCDDFLEYFRQVADCGLCTIEEPFPEARDDLRRLRELIVKHSPATTVTEGESKPDIELLLELGAEGLVQILNVDIEGYGFTRWRALAPRALERGLLLSPHAFDLKLKTHYGAQLLAGLGGSSPLEGVIDQTEGVDFEAYTLREGMLTVPDAPGFGMRLIWGRGYDRNGLDDSGYPMT